MNSFLKWPGGKKWLIKKYPEIFKANEMKTYIEPFVGSGAVLFYLEPEDAIISDINTALIQTYQTLRDSPEEVRDGMIEHQKKHCKKYYYQIREKQPINRIEHAARFIYLNRTAFNGMYRVNKKGEFNVPIGTKSKFDYDFDWFTNYAQLLKRCEINTADFSISIEKARKGDFIFADPPYTVSHNNNGFLQYNEQLFSWEDQVRLHNVLTKAKDKGIQILTTNAAFADLGEMYQDVGFYKKTVSRFSSISGKSTGRKKREEYIFSTFDLSEMKG